MRMQGVHLSEEHHRPLVLPRQRAQSFRRSWCKRYRAARHPGFAAVDVLNQAWLAGWVPVKVAAVHVAERTGERAVLVHGGRVKAGTVGAAVAVGGTDLGSEAGDCCSGWGS